MESGNNSTVNEPEFLFNKSATEPSERVYTQYPVLSTHKILRDKALNRDIDESWVSWAQEMMEAGFESINLYTLAGISRPYNQFELIELTEAVLSDLHIDFTDHPVMIRSYVYFIVKKGIDDVSNYLSVLREINDIYIELAPESEYQDLYLLYYAKDDLNEAEHQWYWDGANRQNIDAIIRERFQAFINECDLNSKFSPYRPETSSLPHAPRSHST